MKHTFYPLALCAAVLLGSCGKDNGETPLALTGEYQATKVLAATNPIRMYTKTGEIANVPLVDSYIRRQFGTRPSFFSRTDVAIAGLDLQTLTIDANDQATLATFYQTNTTRVNSRITLRTPHYFVLTAADSASTLIPVGAPNRCVQLLDQIKTIAPIKRCYPLPGITGYIQGCKFQPVQVVSIQNRQLFFPVLSWLVVRGQPSSGTCTYGFADERNIFNSAMLNQLVDGDTLVVQERQIALTKL